MQLVRQTILAFTLLLLGACQEGLYLAADIGLPQDIPQPSEEGALAHEGETISLRPDQSTGGIDVIKNKLERVKCVEIERNSFECHLEVIDNKTRKFREVYADEVKALKWGTLRYTDALAEDMQYSCESDSSNLRYYCKFAIRPTAEQESVVFFVPAKAHVTILGTRLPVKMAPQGTIRVDY